MVLKSKVKNQLELKRKESEITASVDRNMSNKSPTRSKTFGRTKSPSRARMSSRNRSPTRTKSPSRTKSPPRIKSPSRTKSPSRKSPTRGKKDVSPPPLQSSTPKVPSPKPRSPIRRTPSRKSPTRISKSLTTDNLATEKVLRSRRDNIDDSKFDHPKVDKQLILHGRTRRLEVQVEKMEVKELKTSQQSKISEQGTFNILKRITSHSSQNPEEERIVHLKHFDNIANQMGEFSDEDDIHTRKSESLERDLETMPTTKGKKLICSGFWGFVRHPNYLGDILINLSFAPFALTVPPVLTVIAIILLLIHRSGRDNKRCKLKYGAAWDRYCSKVRYVLIPKVY